MDLPFAGCLSFYLRAAPSGCFPPLAPPPCHEAKVLISSSIIAHRVFQGEKTQHGPEAVKYNLRCECEGGARADVLVPAGTGVRGDGAGSGRGFWGADGDGVGYDDLGIG